MKKILALCLSLILAVSMSTTAFATAEGAVIFEKNANVYVDVAPNVTVDQNVEYVVADSITVGADETIDITVKQNMMFYNNTTTLYFLGYSLNTSNNNSNGNVVVTLKKGSETIATNTVDKNTIGASIANGIYVYGSSTVTITLAPNAITAKAGKAVLLDNIALTDRSNTGKVSVYTTVGASNASNRVLTSVKVASPTTTVTKNSFLLDKTFSTEDSVSSLTADGWSVGSPASITDANGISYSGHSNYTVAYTGAKFSGAYTFVAKLYKSYNHYSIKFNYVDSSNYYEVYLNGANSGNALSIRKVVAGTPTNLLEPETTLATHAQNTTWTITTTPLDTGDLQIDLAVKNNNSTKTYTVTDYVADDYTPNTVGTISVTAGAPGTFRALSMKVYPGTTAPTVTGELKLNGAVTDTYAPGASTFTFPVAVIGQTPDVIAALYENHEMTDVKVLDITQLNSGDVALFNTTAEDASIKVFVWNSIAGMAPIFDPFVLE